MSLGAASDLPASDSPFYKPNFVSLPYGKLDFISDTHSCHRELMDLLQRLGYDKFGNHPNGRKLVLGGDHFDRGNMPVEMARFLISARPYSVMGNHDWKLLRYLRSPDWPLPDHAQKTYDALDKAGLLDEVRDYLETLHTYIVADEGSVVIAHAGIKGHHIGEINDSINRFCLHGEFGPHGALPYWVKSYSGNPLVVYGHTFHAQPQIENNTVNIDQGVSFGMKMTALRYPERKFVQVDALERYAV